MKKTVLRTEKVVLHLPTGDVEVGPSSVGTVSVSTLSNKEFIKEFKDAARKDLFSQVPIDNGRSPS